MIRTFHLQECDMTSHEEHTSAYSDEAAFFWHGFASAFCRNVGWTPGFDSQGFAQWLRAFDIVKHLALR
mgnify:CR=1 FL=1